MGLPWSHGDSRRFMPSAWQRAMIGGSIWEFWESIVSGEVQGALVGYPIGQSLSKVSLIGWRLRYQHVQTWWSGVDSKVAWDNRSGNNWELTYVPVAFWGTMRCECEISIKVEIAKSENGLALYWGWNCCHLIINTLVGGGPHSSLFCNLYILKKKKNTPNHLLVIPRLKMIRKIIIPRNKRKSHQK